MDFTNLIDTVSWTPGDELATEDLIKVLRDDFNQFESEEESNKRKEVLAKLHDIVTTWIYDVAISLGQDVNTASKAGGKIYTFGSYRLGVHGPGTDIDTLCVGPRFVDR